MKDELDELFEQMNAWITDGNWTTEEEDINRLERVFERWKSDGTRCPLTGARDFSQFASWITRELINACPHASDQEIRIRGLILLRFAIDRVEAEQLLLSKGTDS